MLSKSDVFFSAKENEQMWARVTSAELVLQRFLPNNRNKSWWCANLKQIPLRPLSELALRFTTMDAKKEQTSSISNLSSALTLAFKKLLPLMKNILIRGFAEIPTLYQQIAPPYTLALVKVMIGRVQEQVGNHRLLSLHLSCQLTWLLAGQWVIRYFNQSSAVKYRLLSEWALADGIESHVKAE